MSHDAITAIGQEILDTLAVQRSEEYYPGSDPDRMDSRIADAKKRVTLIRRIREELEDELSKPLGSS